VKSVYGKKWPISVLDSENTKKKKSMPDVNIPNTLLESLKNKIAECTNHGLNSSEIASLYLKKTSKAVLVRIIKDLMETSPTYGGK